MVLLHEYSVPQGKLWGLNLIPKSGNRGASRVEAEGIWPGYSFQGRARGPRADTSPAWSARASNDGAPSVPNRVTAWGRGRWSGWGALSSRRASAACG